MEMKKISLSAKLAGKSLVGFDTSAWGSDADSAAGTAKTKFGVEAKIGSKRDDRLLAKIGAKLGAKTGSKVCQKIVETWLGETQGSL